MTSIVIAVDGSDASLAAVHALIKHRPLFKDAPKIHLIHVCLPIPRLYGAHYVVDAATIERIVREDAEQAMISSKILLDKWGVPHESAHFVGEIAPMVAKIAEEKKADFVYVGARGLGAFRGAILGSTTMKLLQVSRTPVVVVHAQESTK
jgi:nucleotide-binding universal stress UspA family protein